MAKAFLRLPDQTVWPNPHEVGELEWQLRYGSLTRNQALMAASVMAAYNALATCTDKRRREVVSGMRAVLPKFSSEPKP